MTTPQRYPLTVSIIDDTTPVSVREFAEYAIAMRHNDLPTAWASGVRRLAMAPEARYLMRRRNAWRLLASGPTPVGSVRPERGRWQVHCIGGHARAAEQACSRIIGYADDRPGALALLAAHADGLGDEPPSMP